MSHHGEPAEEEEEVIVIEEPEKEERGEPKVVRAPRVPTQEERDAHEATHIPHEEWCEVCVAGRGRNKAHRKRKEAPGWPQGRLPTLIAPVHLRRRTTQ